MSALKTIKTLIHRKISVVLVFLFLLWFQKVFMQEWTRIDARLRRDIAIVGSYAWAHYLEDLANLLAKTKRVDEHEV